MNKLFSKFYRFWDEDRSLSVMLLLLLAYIVVLVPVLNRGRGADIVIRLFYTVILITGILSVTRHKKTALTIGAFAIFSIITNWINYADPGNTSLVAKDIAFMLFNFIFAIAILIKTFKPGDITFHRIQGAVVVYLVLGMLFACAFHLIFLLSGNAAFNNITGPELKVFLYFSFTTLTTVGYGDISPIHPLARSLANFEALLGQLYPAILIARLVSMEFESSQKKKREM